MATKVKKTKEAGPKVKKEIFEKKTPMEDDKD
jgi:hypothetical protein